MNRLRVINNNLVHLSSDYEKINKIILDKLFNNFSLSNLYSAENMKLDVQYIDILVWHIKLNNIHKKFQKTSKECLRSNFFMKIVASKFKAILKYSVFGCSEQVMKTNI